jgi:6-methylsalicylate decarboxylase
MKDFNAVAQGHLLASPDADAGGATARAKRTSAGRSPRRIDVHHHFLPQQYMREEHERIPSFTHGGVGSLLLNWTPQHSLEDMDRNGIATAFGSVSTPGVWHGNVDAARRLSREWNESAARAVADYPGRFGFFAVVAPPDTEGALREIEYALDVLKADGIGLLSNYDDKPLGNPEFAPVMEELNRRKAVVYVHPTIVDCCRNMIPGIMPQTIEYPFATTRTITSLIFNGTLGSLPDIRWIFSHGGGTVPFLADRISMIDRNPEVAQRNPNGTIHELKKLYYDTAGAVSAPQLAAMMLFFPHSHILFGSDYPFVTAAHAVEGLAKYKIPAATRAAIDRGNAMELLSRLHV